MTLQASAGMGSLRQHFRDAPEPALTDLVGDFEAEYAGPLWIRLAGPITLAALGMPGWWGKRFALAGDHLEGVNLLKGLRESQPMTASVEPASLDGRPAIVVRYTASARWPLRGCRDEVRVVGDVVLMGLTYGIPGAPRGGTPFLLHRRAGA